MCGNAVFDSCVTSATSAYDIASAPNSVWGQNQGCTVVLCRCLGALHLAAELLPLPVVKHKLLVNTPMFSLEIVESGVGTVAALLLVHTALM